MFHIQALELLDLTQINYRQFQATRGLFETGMQYDPLTGLQGLAQQEAPQIGQVGSLLGADIGAYQSPYQQQVIDQSMADIQRQADIAKRSSTIIEQSVLVHLVALVLLY